MKKLSFILLFLRSLCVTALRSFLSRVFNHRAGQCFDSAGTQIYYTVEGRGEPLILVHGFGASADVNWRIPGVTTTLTKNFQVISLDMRGHGRSDKPEEAEAYGVELVNDVVRLMDHLKLDKAHVVGYSMGGFTTLKLAELHPDRLLSAAPCGAGYAQVDDENVTKLIKVAGNLIEKKGFRPLLEVLEPPSLLRGLKIWYTDIGMRITNTQPPLGHLMQAFANLAIEKESLAKNTVPMLTIIGERDPLREYAEAMRGITANHEIAVLEGADHMNAMLHVDFIPFLTDFLARQKS